MGLMHYAIGKTNRQAMEMGKHYFECLEGKKFTDRDELARVLLKHFEEGQYAKECITMESAFETADKLLAIDTEFELVTENDPAANYPHIVIVKSFYVKTSYIGDLLSTHLDRG